MSHDRVVKQARSAIDALILAVQSPSVHRVATALSMSPRSYQRQLAKAGVWHRDLVLEGRLDLARRLLAETAKPVREVGRRLGYKDPSHFSRFFRRATGTTPSDYRYRCQSRRRKRFRRRSKSGLAIDSP